MAGLAWLLVAALGILVALLVFKALREGVLPDWFRWTVTASGAFFTAVALLLLWEAVGPQRAGSTPTQAAALPVVSAAMTVGIEGPPIEGAGRKVFVESGCHRCHTVGAGPLVGPDLVDAAVRYQQEFLVRWILDPEGIYRELGVQSVNPVYPPMPPSAVSDDEALLIARYLASFPRGEAKAGQD